MTRILTENEARDLMARFLDGATTSDEEQLLAAYFQRTPRVPDDLEPLREMMAWYDSGLRSDKIRRYPWRQAWWRIAALAAGLCVVAILAVWLWDARMERQELLASYAGSYVVRDGVRYDNIEEILPELRRAEEIAECDNELDALVLRDSVVAGMLNSVADEATRRALIKTLCE